MTTDQSFLLTFTSDNSISGKGFRIRFKVVQEGCKGVIKSNGKILIPDDKYAETNNVSCFWSINAPLNFNIELKFETFDLSPEDNCSESIHTAFDKQQRIFCGDNIPPRRVVTDSNVVNITFSSLKSPKFSKKDEKYYIEILFVERINTVSTAHPSSTQCGVQSVPFTSVPVSERIVNGKVAANGNFPWLVMIGRPGITCGGTLVSNR